MEWIKVSFFVFLFFVVFFVFVVFPLFIDLLTDKVRFLGTWLLRRVHLGLSPTPQKVSFFGFLVLWFFGSLVFWFLLPYL